MKKIYALLFVLLIPIVCGAKTNLTMKITNNSIVVWNDEISPEIITWNPSDTILNRTFTWDVEDNVTCNQTYNCNHLENDLEELRVAVKQVNCSQDESVYDDAKKYYDLYRGCFENYTICSEYRKSNTQHYSNFQSCENVKNQYYLENMELTADFFLLNKTHHSVVQEKEDMSGQRPIMFVLGGIVFLGVYLLYTKVFRESKKLGSFMTKKNLSPTIGTVNPDDVKEVSAKNSTGMINPEDVK